MKRAKHSKVEEFVVPHFSFGRLTPVQSVKSIQKYVDRGLMNTPLSIYVADDPKNGGFVK